MNPAGAGPSAIPPSLDTTLMQYAWVVIRFRCHICKRAGDARLAVCAQRYGANATLGSLLGVFMSRCPYDPHNPARKPQKYSYRCGAYLPDVMRSGPPDLPPAMMGLTLIEGGKGDMLPAKPGAEPHRRRVGDT
ncbi:hypothetical protein BHK69_09915 [Bosea vaviloviae]|uniref:Uncharacterized protein n=2 Tax=Bosea vaviloviae TaxID=1526658 RepID=A0A1D7UAD8_9HYPH|nr:hypothetical protein BHK69_09915 [Bosea vaviloviae]